MPTFTRSVPATAPLRATLQRTVAATSWFSGGRRRTIPALAWLGTRYQRTVPATGWFTLPPANNMPAGAFVITPATPIIDVVRTGATTEPYDPVPVIGALSKTVYYRLRTVSAGTLLLTYNEASVRAAIALYIRTAVQPPVFSPVTSHVAAFVGWDATINVGLLAMSEYLIQFGELA